MIRRLSIHDIMDTAQATIYLAQARWVHRRKSVSELLRIAKETKGLTGRDQALATRVSRAVPRAARRVPWRSDCFVQALAAQFFLANHGVGSELFIGVRKDGDKFSAHAWLRHDGLTITGGDFSSYHPIVTPETDLEV